MKYKRILKRILSENRPYDSYYPEHKPIFQKLTDMKVKNFEECLLENIQRNKKFLKDKNVQFSKTEKYSKLKNNYYKLYETLHWLLEFDLTEEYIWSRVLKTDTSNIRVDEFVQLLKLPR